MIDKIARSVAEALDGIEDGSTVLIGGFGEAGVPNVLVEGMIEQGARDLVLVNNNAGVGRHGIAALLATGRVRKMICSFPRSVGSVVFPELYAAGKIELEVVPQGTLSERIRAGGAGLGGFFTPTGVGTQVANGKEVRRIDGRDYLLELPIRGDVALVKGHIADRFGNLTYRKAARNFGPSMAMAGRRTVAEVSEVHADGGLDPERVVTPGIFVDAVVKVER